MLKFIGFRTPHEKGFLVFGMPNAKYLAFGIPDGNALVKNIMKNVIKIVELVLNITTIMK